MAARNAGPRGGGDDLIAVKIVLGHQQVRLPECASQSVVLKREEVMESSARAYV